MAASCTNVIRVRLYFDYPPPSVSDCRMCWVLVDLNKCRVVADLASIIREKFDFSRRSVLSLFIEDCYLPHTESIYVVRDNDSIRVKVEILNLANGHHLNTSVVNVKKRGRDAQEEEMEESPIQNGVSEGRKKKKNRRKEDSQEADSYTAAVEEECAEHKKKTRKKKEAKKNLVEPKATVSSTGPCPAKPERNTKKAPAPAATTVTGKTTSKTNNAKTDCLVSSSSEEEEASSKKPTKKPPVKNPSASSISTITPNNASKAAPTVKTPAPIKKPLPPPSSSSSDSDSSDSPDNDAASKVTVAQPPVKNKTGLSYTGPTNSESNGLKVTGPGEKKTQSKPSDSNDSSSEEEIELVIKRPVPGLGLTTALGSEPAWRGNGNPRVRERGRGVRGRGGDWNRVGGWDRGPQGGGRGGRGQDIGAGGGDQVEVSFEYGRGHRTLEQNPQQQLPSYQSDSLTNNSVVFENPPLPNPPQSAPMRDYSTMPLLASPPPVGQKIAFKLLELTENYTPEVSEYKEGRIISFDYNTKQVELELLSGHQASVVPGKFDLVYQNVDGSETVEYAVTRGSRVTERWDSLLEPRLVMMNSG